MLSLGLKRGSARPLAFWDAGLNLSLVSAVCCQSLRRGDCSSRGLPQRVIEEPRRGGLGPPGLSNH